VGGRIAQEVGDVLPLDNIRTTKKRLFVELTKLKKMFRDLIMPVRASAPMNKLNHQRYWIVFVV